MQSDYDSGLGSGEVEYTRGRPIIHFGSPAGVTYAHTRKPLSPIRGASRTNLRRRRVLG